jgi:hypothetical protein
MTRTPTLKGARRWNCCCNVHTQSWGMLPLLSTMEEISAGGQLCEPYYQVLSIQHLSNHWLNFVTHSTDCLNLDSVRPLPRGAFRAYGSTCNIMVSSLCFGGELSLV